MDEEETKVLLSAAERRERRMKRILGNSEERLSKILSGPNGEYRIILTGKHLIFMYSLEKRLAPALEGGESLFNLPPLETETVIVKETYPGDKTLSGGSTFTPTFHSSSFSKWRFPMSFIIGICARLVMLYGYEKNIILPWIIIFATFEFLFSNKRNESNSLNNELMPFLLVFQGSEKLLRSTC
uniref:Ubiquitin-fold modifier 1 n=1 Tax=Heterorhabditis bacteriophora TaxID=37862 RepID=A0A1I7WMR0_HETBA